MSKSPTEKEKERMRELREQGYGLKIIARRVGFSSGTVHKYTKDIRIQIERYQKTLLTARAQRHHRLIHLCTINYDQFIRRLNWVCVVLKRNH